MPAISGRADPSTVADASPIPAANVTPTSNREEKRWFSLRGEASTVRQILDYLGEPTRPPRIAPARGPLLWEAAATSPPAGNDPHWELGTQPLPEIEFDQRLAW